MKDSTNSKDGLPKMPSGVPKTKIAGKSRDLRCPDGKPLEMSGLAVVPFETVSEFHPSVDEEIDFITEFDDLNFIVGLPDPYTLRKWLIADKVLEDWGEPLGLIPVQRYVEAGLFYCVPMVTKSHLGISSPEVTLGILPRGIMWLKRNYIPTPQRHRCVF